jgi:hypothetical protein
MNFLVLEEVVADPFGTLLLPMFPIGFPFRAMNGVPVVNVHSKHSNMHLTMICFTNAELGVTDNIAN